MPGRFTSISTRSGWSVAAWVTPSSPVSASPTTSKPSVASTTMRAASRNGSWSSTISTRTGICGHPHPGSQRRQARASGATTTSRLTRGSARPNGSRVSWRRRCAPGAPASRWGPKRARCPTGSTSRSSTSRTSASCRPSSSDSGTRTTSAAGVAAAGSSVVGCGGRGSLRRRHEAHRIVLRGGGRLLRSLRLLRHAARRRAAGSIGSGSGTTTTGGGADALGSATRSGAGSGVAATGSGASAGSGSATWTGSGAAASTGSGSGAGSGRIGSASGIRRTGTAGAGSRAGMTSGIGGSMGVWPPGRGIARRGPGGHRARRQRALQIALEPQLRGLELVEPFLLGLDPLPRVRAGLPQLLGLGLLEHDRRRAAPTSGRSGPRVPIGATGSASTATPVPTRAARPPRGRSGSSATGRGWPAGSRRRRTRSRRPCPARWTAPRRHGTAAPRLPDRAWSRSVATRGRRPASAARMNSSLSASCDPTSSSGSVEIEQRAVRCPHADRRHTAGSPPRRRR